MAHCFTLFKTLKFWTWTVVLGTSSSW